MRHGEPSSARGRREFAERQHSPESLEERGSADSFDLELAERVRTWREAERPILDDLAAIGIRVGEVSSLGKTGKLEAIEALPVLMDHLERGNYPDRVLQGIGHIMAVRESVQYWDRLKDCWLKAQGPEACDGVASALAACATARQLDDMIAFLAVEGAGESRIHFLGKVLRLGKENGRAVVEQYRDDPVLGREATALLARQARRARKPSRDGA